MQDDLNGRTPLWKNILIESTSMEDLQEARTELGKAQLQFVLYKHLHSQKLAQRFAGHRRQQVRIFIWQF